MIKFNPKCIRGSRCHCLRKGDYTFVSLSQKEELLSQKRKKNTSPALHISPASTQGWKLFSPTTMTIITAQNSLLGFRGGAAGLLA